MVAARELKEAVSAAPQTEVFIEELLPEKDMKLAVTREETEGACQELYDAFARTNPLRQLAVDGHLNRRPTAIECVAIESCESLVIISLCTMSLM